jgi:hypothetical protein
LQQALAVFRPTAYKTAFFSGCCCKTEVLQQPLYLKDFEQALKGTGSVEGQGKDQGNQQPRPEGTRLLFL